MNHPYVSNRMGGADVTAIAKPNAGAPLKIAFVYQDAFTRQRAQQVLDRIAAAVSNVNVHPTECKIEDLRQVKAFSEGVADLARAEVIVVSLYEADRLPATFYLWVNLWLQVRGGRAGTMFALVAPSEDVTFGVQETRRYLCAAAQQGGLELVECDRPGKPLHGLQEDGVPCAKAA